MPSGNSLGSWDGALRDMRHDRSLPVPGGHVYSCKLTRLHLPVPRNVASSGHTRSRLIALA
jgi:hypothetical protein